MIIFDLLCSEGHRFEGWFASSSDYASQCENGMLICPECGSPKVEKAPMAPAVPRKGNQQVVARPAADSPSDEGVAMTGGEIPPEVAKAMEKLAEVQKKALEGSKWVGDKFAEQSRAMYYGERESETIHGKATLKEAKELAEEGVPVSALPFPIAPPDELN